MAKQTGEQIEKKLEASIPKLAPRRSPYSLGGGLYVQVTSASSRSLLCRFMKDGKDRWMGLGSWPVVTLPVGRQKVLEARQLLEKGIDPIGQRREAKAEAVKQVAVEKAKAITLDQQFDEFYRLYEQGLSNAKHKEQWRHTWRDYVSPLLGNRPVGSIVIDDVLAVLEPIWYLKPETAVRVRGRLEMVLQSAIIKGRHPGPNPAEWHNKLQMFLKPRSKIGKVEHHPAIEWKGLPEFMRRLRQLGGFGAMALEWIILNACRSGEGLTTLWSEIDREGAIWTTPASKMKARREHRKPLSTAALVVLDKAAAVRSSDAVFPGQDGKRPITDAGLSVVLKRLGRTDITVHGFRSTFRTWVADNDKSETLAEMALAHTQTRLNAAYQRSDMLERRRDLMQAWADFCDGKTSPAKQEAAA